ncbi:MAG TPA: dihydrofolate reductase family protein [Mycobacteriales bacterium]|nr:dihydrofolate reductase family protein [Mycobacteriales bacterium]
MRRLLPPPVGPSVDSPVDLDEVYAWPERCVRGLMVASVDGRAAVAGSSEPLSGPADRRVLSVLRGTCDVVLCGASTVRAEGWRPPRPSPQRRAWRAQRGMPEVPAYAVVSRSGDLPSGDSEGEVLVLPGGPEGLDDLAARGLRRVLCEGGPTLLAGVAAAGRLDELCLTTSPLLTGPGRLGLLEGAPWPATVPTRLVSLLEQDGFLFSRWAVG